MWNFIVPAIVGAGISMLQNRDPIQGALIGGATGGLLGGGFEGFGSALTSGGASGVANTTTPVLGGLTASGATSAIPGSFSAVVPSATASGIATSVPQTAGGYSSLLGGESILEPYNIGMNGVTSQLNTGATTAGIDLGSNVASNAMNQRFTPSLMTTDGARGIPVDQAVDQSTFGGYQYTPEELDELDITPIDDAEDKTVMEKITDTTGLEKKDLTLLGINQFAQLGDVKENKPGVVQLPAIQRKEPKLGKPVATNVALRQIKPRFYSA